MVRKYLYCNGTLEYMPNKMESTEFTRIMDKGYNKEKLEIEFHQNLLNSTDWKEHVLLTYIFLNLEQYF